MSFVENRQIVFVSCMTTIANSKLVISLLLRFWLSTGYVVRFFAITTFDTKLICVYLFEFSPVSQVWPFLLLQVKQSSSWLWFIIPLVPKAEYMLKSS